MISAPAPFLLEEAGSIIPGGQLGTTKGEQRPVACLDTPLSATGFFPFSKEARLDSGPCHARESSGNPNIQGGEGSGVKGQGSGD